MYKYVPRRGFDVCSLTWPIFMALSLPRSVTFFLSLVRELGSSVGGMLLA